MEVRRTHKRVQGSLESSTHDQLTNLPLRNLFYHRLEENLVSAKSANKTFALILIHLNGLHENSDTIEHQAGDALLQQVEHCLQGRVRKSDTVDRLGKAEFGVLLPELDSEAAGLAAERLVRALEIPFVVAGISLSVQASIGFALFPEHGITKDALMRYADIAMYLAKDSGSGYALYSPERDSYSRDRLALMADLHRAIELNQLFLVYQPKLNLQTGAITGVEALARWQHPELGIIPPDRFITLAERTGFIKPLTMWGLETSLTQTRTWSEAGSNVPISVNLSARALHDRSFPDRVKELLEGQRIAPEQLELEITESGIMFDPAGALEILRRISSMGVALSIDDFGTGHSSLSYLKKLPVKAVKMDKSFVVNMANDQNDAQILRSTIDLAHSLGLKIIAEGVENREAWDQLLALGCDEAQGYYMSRPLAGPEMKKWLGKKRMSCR